MFLNSYRDHMEGVAKELIRFRKMAKEREFDLRRDKKIAKLQNQCDHFRGQALALKS